MSDIPESPAFTDAPTEGQSSKLTELGNRFRDVEQQIKHHTALLEQLEKERYKLRHETLPQYMQAIGQDRIGLFDCDIALQPYYNANIAADWPLEKRNKAFDYLISIGEGDLIKVTLTYTFRREELEQARELSQHIQEQFPDAPDPSIKMSVQWQTLTAWLRQRTERGLTTDLEKIGGYIGWISTIKNR